MKSSPIEEFLNHLGADGSEETLMELRVHLEESAEGFVELGLSRVKAELAAIGLLGDRGEVEGFVRGKQRSWKELFWGDRRVLRNCFLMGLSIHVLPMWIMSSSQQISSGQNGWSMSLAVFWLLFLAICALYCSVNAYANRRVGAFSICTFSFLGMFVGTVLAGLLFSTVPSEIGGVVFRWELFEKHQEWMAWNSQFLNIGVTHISEQVSPGDIDFEVAKRDMWDATVGKGVFGTIWLNFSRWDIVSHGWLLLVFFCGIFGFFSRYIRGQDAGRKVGRV